MEKNDSTGKWIVTNLDGSFHKHVKYGGVSQEAIQQTGSVVHKDTPEISEAKITANLRTEAIAKAHDENIEANERLRQAITALTDKLGDLERIFLRYLEGAKP
jgi:hypothetical protein